MKNVLKFDMIYIRMRACNDEEHMENNGEIATLAHQAYTSQQSTFLFVD